METDGTYESRDTRGAAVPHPAAPPVPPAPTPPMPPHAPAAAPSRSAGVPGPRSAVADWLDAPRPETAPGIWRFRHVPPTPPRERNRLAPITVAGLVIPVLIALILWSVWRRGGVPYLWVPLQVLTPEEWWYAGTTTARDWHGVEAHIVYSGVVFGAIVFAVARLGAWGTVVRHLLEPYGPRARAALTAAAGLIALTFVFPEWFPFVGWDPLPIASPFFSLLALLGGGYDIVTTVPLYLLSLLITVGVLWPFARVGDWRGVLRGLRASRRPAAAAPGAPAPRSTWPALRAAGQAGAADLLAAELLGGRMNDVDAARIQHRWDRGRDDARQLAGFVDTVLQKGAAAWAHPSGDRDLPRRLAAHDLLLGQVRIGRAVAGERNPAAYRGAGVALDPAVLGTSMLVVGPPGGGQAGGLTAAAAEALTLQALTGACAVVAVGGSSAPYGPDAAYDVVIRLGDPTSPYDLDLYGGLTEPDEAAALLAEGLAGDVETLDPRRAGTVLAQLLGPYRAVHGTFPPVPVLRELLEAGAGPLTDLLGRLPADAAAMRRELEGRIRQAGGPTDPGPLLADRLALLDRPAFADFFGAGTGTARPFSLDTVAHHPLRVRLELPEHGHEEASRLLARLVLAQFLAAARSGGRRAHFAGLVLDDATGALTGGTIRALQRLRTRDAGVVLGLRTLGDVPEPLHGPLLAAVGCRAALSGVTTWDGRGFAEAWGTEWVETEEVAHHTVFADQPMTRALHALRKRVTGKAVTTDAVTLKKVERERWSASELAHSVPPGHAVVSLTTVRGEHMPPVLVDLRA
ncbi:MULTISPECIES: ATP/GTP-binding protein [Streptomyces]|uniref:ATP/GTP-binding protein n=2 Tax=Streptomyces TaxID=1883 RepID=A0ABU4KB35_9ACTN|nr:ATP/GTP-binding protein [Streptomyces roseolus]MDX2294989.1 ATP/GTP-binding protein [Streptomyces roseolus]